MVCPYLISGMQILHSTYQLYTRYPIVARRAWPTGCIGRVRRASKGILHTTESVVPVHKKGYKSDVQNYRPISLTCIIMNVMEKIVKDELMARCGQLIDPRQHGFLKNKSYNTQLVDFCDTVSLKTFVQMSFILIFQRLLILSIMT